MFLSEYTCTDFPSFPPPPQLSAGNEGYGLHSGVEKACTALLTISPQRQLPQGFDSLNVAVATGIILHSLQNRKSHPQTHEQINIL